MLSIFYARTSLFIVLNKAVLGEFSDEFKKAVLVAPYKFPLAEILTKGQIEAA